MTLLRTNDLLLLSLAVLLPFVVLGFANKLLLLYRHRQVWSVNRDFIYSIFSPVHTHTPKKKSLNGTLLKYVALNCSYCTFYVFTVIFGSMETNMNIFIERNTNYNNLKPDEGARDKQTCYIC